MTVVPVDPPTVVPPMLPVTVVPVDPPGGAAGAAERCR